MLHALFFLLSVPSGVSVSWDIKALDGPEATLKGKILQSHTGKNENQPPSSKYLKTLGDQQDCFVPKTRSTFLSDTFHQTNSHMSKGTVRPNYKHFSSSFCFGIEKCRQFGFCLRFPSATITKWRSTGVHPLRPDETWVL